MRRKFFIISGKNDIIFFHHDLVIIPFSHLQIPIMFRTKQKATKNDMFEQFIVKMKEPGAPAEYCPD